VEVLIAVSILVSAVHAFTANFSWQRGLDRGFLRPHSWPGFCYDAGPAGTGALGIRQWHSYIGLFIAPSVLFFALTGAAQLLNLHEAHGNYQPPAILEKLSSVHKDQVFAPGHHHEPLPPDAEDQKPRGDGVTGPRGKRRRQTELSTLLLKAFFLVVALCLVLSTALGFWMGLTQTRQKRLAWMLVVARTLIPVGLPLF
jgi:hypothetical protein